MERRSPLEEYQKKIKEKLNVVPLEPGCYLMKDRNDQVIYVGKAKRLRNRLRSYFTGAHDAKTTRLVGEIRNFEFIVTSSETESLLLELNLIKQYQPRYNILLKDDKSYPFIKITKEKHPRLLVTRTVKRIQANTLVHTLMHILHKKQRNYLIVSIHLENAIICQISCVFITILDNAWDRVSMMLI